MAGIFAISVDPGRYGGDFKEDFFKGTLYQQHLGEKQSGVAVYNGSEIVARSCSGLFRSNFQKGSLDGSEAIGYCGLNQEPSLHQTRIGGVAACFSGNITNHHSLKMELLLSGQTFGKGDEIETIVKLLVEEGSLIDGIFNLTQKIKGSCALVALNGSGIYAATFPGHWPLVIGEKKGAVALSTDSSGFRNIGFRIVRSLEPGEIVSMKWGEIRTEKVIPLESKKICSFFFVYTAFPTGLFNQVLVSEVRKKLGAALARRDIQRGFIPDLVAPIPDSGRFNAIGYHQEFCRQANKGEIDKIPLFDEVLLKYPYTGRSFTATDKEARKWEADIKLLGSNDDYQGQKLVVCDDSIVRGTQAQTQLVPKLRRLGFSEIHFRISNPELFSRCLWGNTTKEGEFFSLRYPSLESKKRALEIDGIEFNNRTDLIEAIGLPKHLVCQDCSFKKRQAVY